MNVIEAMRLSKENGKPYARRISGKHYVGVYFTWTPRGQVTITVDDLIYDDYEEYSQEKADATFPAPPPAGSPLAAMPGGKVIRPAKLRGRPGRKGKR